MLFALTDEQAELYKSWVKDISGLHFQADENLDQITISFTFTPQGQYIQPHTGNPIPSDGLKLVLQDIFE